MRPEDNLLRFLPKMDALLEQARDSFSTWYRQEDWKEALRAELDSWREKIPDLGGPLPEVEEILQGARKRLREEKRLRRVINATGIINHTNLGRAVLSPQAVQRVAMAASGYTNLEFDVSTGKRGNRADHINTRIAGVTGAEAAVVVNNNAAAVFLMLTALAKGREVVVSRGELVEIGGSFRVPDIMSESGAVLREVGTTNRTRLADYENAIGPETGAILKVHPSNYRVVGFTESVGIRDLAKLAKKHNIPLLADMGAGLLVSLSEEGIDEPTVSQWIAEGADVVAFSGDKLLGGPQGGFLIGKKPFIDACAKHPLLRALRVDKLTMAAMEATLAAYRNSKLAKMEIPFLKMVLAKPEALQKQAEMLRARLQQIAPSHAEKVLVVSTEDLTGGGAAPTRTLPGFGVAIALPDPEKVLAALREAPKPIIGRIVRGQVILSMRCLLETDADEIAKWWTQYTSDRATS